MGTLVVASAPQVPADEHAQQLLTLGQQRWYLPAKVVAKAAGFEGDGAIRALNNWVGKLKKNGAVPEDIREYNVYPVDWQDDYYIAGNEKLSSEKQIDIGFSLYDQKVIVGLLEQPVYRDMLLYGMGLNNDAAQEVKDGWIQLVVPLCCEYSSVFHLELRRHHPSSGNDSAKTRRQCATELATTLREMCTVGVLSLQTPPAAPSPPAPSPSAPRVAPSPSPSGPPVAPSPSAPPAAPVAKMIPALINFKSDNKVWSDGNERRAFEDRTRISMIRMKEADVSDVQAPALLVDLLRLWGHTIEGDLPTRDIAKQATEEGGMLAFCMIAQQLLDWGLTDEQQLECVTAVNTECDREVLTERKGCPQVATACADGASIGEDKFIAVAMQKLIEVQGVEAVQKKFVRVALPLIHLADGSDEVKQAALMDSMEDILTCYNTICAPESEEMTMYDIARIIGFCVNDHAESVVKNQFAPALQKIIEAANGTEQEVALTRLWLWSGVPPVLPVITKIFVFGEPQRGAFIEPDGKPAGYLTRQNHSYRLSMKETKVGSKLVAMYLESEASRGRVSRMLYRTRKYRVEFGQRMLDHKKQVLADRIIGYELARQKKREKDATSAAELEKMRGEARRWVHLEMSHRSERRSASSTISTRREAVPTITSLVEQTREQTRGSESVKNQAAQAMLLRWLTVFHTVHGLSGVSSLASVFFNPKSGRLCIKSEPRLSDGKMEDKSLAQLMENVAACSSYLAEKGSPAGFQGDAPGAPGGGGASGPSGMG